MTTRSATLILTTLLALGAAQTARAEDPRLVTATATVTWTDANANSHTPVAASATVAVGVNSRPVLVVTKSAFRADQTTPVDGNVVPGETVFYRVSVTNSGDADAINLVLSDAVPTEVTVEGTTTDAEGWTINVNGNDVDASLADALTPNATRSFWIQVAVR